MLPVTRWANEEAIAGLHLVDDDEKHRVAVHAVTGLFLRAMLLALREKQGLRNASHAKFCILRGG